MKRADDNTPYVKFPITEKAVDRAASILLETGVFGDDTHVSSSHHMAILTLLEKFARVENQSTVRQAVSSLHEHFLRRPY